MSATRVALRRAAMTVDDIRHAVFMEMPKAVPASRLDNRYSEVLGKLSAAANLLYQAAELAEQLKLKATS